MFLFEIYKLKWCHIFKRHIMNINLKVLLTHLKVLSIYVYCLVCVLIFQANSPKVWRSLDLEPNQRPPFKTQRSSSMPTPKTQRSMDVGGSMSKGPSPVGVPSPCSERSARGSVSNDNNILLDPEVLTDYPTHALLLTVLVSSSHLLSR